MKKLKIWQLIVLLIVIVFGGVLFVGLASGWFADKRVTLDAEYRCEEDCGFMELTSDGYEGLIRDKKSFAVLIDQNGCTTADRLKGFLNDYMTENGVKIYKMMFENMKETSLHDFVKYYPSLAVVRDGVVVGYLKADSDEDASAYNNYDDFLNWTRRYLR